jgi:hypothetical protein
MFIPGLFRTIGSLGSSPPQGVGFLGSLCQESVPVVPDGIASFTRGLALGCLDVIVRVESPRAIAIISNRD